MDFALVDAASSLREWFSTVTSKMAYAIDPNDKLDGFRKAKIITSQTQVLAGMKYPFTEAIYSPMCMILFALSGPEERYRGQEAWGTALQACKSLNTNITETKIIKSITGPAAEYYFTLFLESLESFRAKPYPVDPANRKDDLELAWDYGLKFFVAAAYEWVTETKPVSTINLDYAYFSIKVQQAFKN